MDAFVQTLDAGLIIEVVRSGVSGIGRGDRSLKL
jgi:acetolactate synthase small subunit